MPHPWRRRLRGLAALFAAVAVAWFSFITYANWRDAREWADACAEADRLDPGWRWEDLLAALPAVDPAHDSTAHVEAIRPLLPNNRQLDYKARQTPPNRRLGLPLVAALREQVTGPALADADALADCPTGRIPLPADPVPSAWPNAFGIVEVTRSLLYPRLALHAEDGQADAALADVRAMLNAARPSAEAPSLIHNLTAAVVRQLASDGVERVLGQGEPSPAALDAVRRTVEEAARATLLPAFRGERARIEALLRAYDQGRMSREEIGRSKMFADFRPWTGWTRIDDWLKRLTGADFSRGSGTARVRHLTWMIERLKESPDGLQAHAAEWTALRGQLPPTAEFIMTNLSRYVADMQNSEVKVRAAAAALAAEQFRRATGRWPASLAELVPAYLSAVPTDPLDLRPLRLTRRPDGIVIYAVGPDGTDDGGSVWPESGPVKDVGVRLWDPALRRQPPTKLPDSRNGVR